MNSYLALLRGINVSGQKLIKMADLKVVLSKSGLENISTYIQSGNIVFQSNELNTQALELKIHQVIEDRFGFDVPVQVLDKVELDSIIANNPFRDEVISEPNRVLLVRLSQSPEAEKIETLLNQDLSPDRLILVNNWIYLYFPQGQAKSKLSNNLIEQKLKVSSTGRNWNTVLKLSEMLEELPAK
jgi:uncharacterized protein (DUF1697 family)